MKNNHMGGSQKCHTEQKKPDTHCVFMVLRSFGVGTTKL